MLFGQGRWLLSEGINQENERMFVQDKFEGRSLQDTDFI